MSGPMLTPNRPFGPGLHLGFPAAAYRADPCPAPSLNHGTVRLLLSGPPILAWRQHPRLGAQGGAEPTDEMARGSLIHALALGAGDEIAIVDADDWRTKAAREARDAAFAAGEIPVLQRDFEAARELAAPIRERIDAILGDGWSPEVAAFCDHGDHWRRGMLDAVSADGHVILDLKTTGDLSDDAIHRALSRYDTQAAFYLDLVAHAVPDVRGRQSFVFLFVDRDTCDMRAVALSEAWLTSARHCVDKAAKTFVDCVRSGRWPAYSEGVETLHPPPWLIRSRLEEAALADTNTDTTAITDPALAF